MNVQPPTAARPRTGWRLSAAAVRHLMRLYDYPDPRRPGRLIRGYDCPHVRRTARMCLMVASRLGHPTERLKQYEVACLLHDLGRAGLDRRLFGVIWSWARERGLPTRPYEWRSAYPETRHGGETEAFLRRYGPELEAAGIPMDDWAREQVEMRLGYARRFRRQLRAVKPRLRQMGLPWHAWMTRVVLYYYYPQQMQGAPAWVRQLGEVLVACEQFEAHSNRTRGRDYYSRTRETLAGSFAYLESLRNDGRVGQPVLAALQALCAEGAFDDVIKKARGEPLSATDRRLLRRLIRQY